MKVFNLTYESREFLQTLRTQDYIKVEKTYNIPEDQVELCLEGNRHYLTKIRRSTFYMIVYKGRRYIGLLEKNDGVYKVEIYGAYKKLFPKINAFLTRTGLVFTDGSRRDKMTKGVYITVDGEYRRPIDCNDEEETELDFLQSVQVLQNKVTIESPLMKHLYWNYILYNEKLPKWKKIQNREWYYRIVLDNHDSCKLEYEIYDDYDDLISKNNVYWVSRNMSEEEALKAIEDSENSKNE
jgi:hypothetical protein